MDLWNRPPTREQEALARRLVADLTAASAQADGASAFWRDICLDLRQRAGSEDPRYFMRWEPVRATMVHGAAPITFRMLRMLRRSEAWRRVWAPALRHKPHGHPPPFPPMLSTSAMSIEHAGHLFRFRQIAAHHLYDADCIIEFGGGFGSMCRLVRALGFRGRYIVFDLPPGTRAPALLPGAERHRGNTRCPFEHLAMPRPIRNPNGAGPLPAEPDLPDFDLGLERNAARHPPGHRNVLCLAVRLPRADGVSAILRGQRQPRVFPRPQDRK